MKATTLEGWKIRIKPEPGVSHETETTTSLVDPVPTHIAEEPVSPISNRVYLASQAREILIVRAVPINALDSNRACALRGVTRDGKPGEPCEVSLP